MLFVRFGQHGLQLLECRRILKGAADVVEPPDKPVPKDDGVRSSLKNETISIEIQTQDIMTYLLENRGKITLFSGMNGKMHVELGLFGYLGVKYQF